MVTTETCRACGSSIARNSFQGRLRDLEINFYECTQCSYVQTQQPTWLDEAYAEPINASDTGILTRQQSNLKLVVATLALLGSRKGRVVDCAGGYGILVRMLRDVGVDAYWSDPYAANLVAKGFEYRGGSTKLVTAFEAFEHFINPSQELERLCAIAPNILLTTTRIPSPTPLPSDWWYYGLEHGQHVGFFRADTLRYLAKRHGLNLLTDGHSNHLLSRRKLSGKLWFLFQRFAKLNLGLLTQGLRSKTLADHTMIVGSSS